MKLTTIGDVPTSRESGSAYYLAKRYSPEGVDVVAEFEKVFNVTLPENELSSDSEFERFLLDKITGFVDAKGHTFPFYAKGSRCRCEHDCCGHTFLHSADVVGYDDIEQNFIIKQSWGLNV